MDPLYLREHHYREEQRRRKTARHWSMLRLVPVAITLAALACFFAFVALVVAVYALNCV